MTLATGPKYTEARLEQMLLPLENESVSSLEAMFYLSQRNPHARDRILTAAATGSNADSVRLLGHMLRKDPVLAPSLDRILEALFARGGVAWAVSPTLVHDDDGVMAYFDALATEPQIMMRVAGMHPGELNEILDSVDADLVQRCLACDYSDLRTERRGNEHTPAKAMSAFMQRSRIFRTQLLHDHIEVVLDPPDDERENEYRNNWSCNWSPMSRSLGPARGERSVDLLATA